MTVRFVLNGKAVRIEDVDPHRSLLQWLRDSGRTGSKEGCAEGECGACAVARIGRDAEGRARFEAFNSCLVPLGAVDGQVLVSVEGIAGANGSLHPVQRALVEHGGSQCGYCTPGFVVSLFCEYYRKNREHFDPESISGNLCRCTGYRPILDAGRSLPLPSQDDAHLSLLEGPALHSASSDSVSSNRSFVRPATLSEALERLAERPEAVLLGGGTDLMVYANQRFERFPALIALDQLSELQRFSITPREIVLGAGLTLTLLEEHIEKGALALPLLEQLLPLFSSRLIRNRATLGGNLATASPIGDSLPALLALDAELTLASRAGERRLALSDFFLGYRKTALQAGELIVSIHLPRPLPGFQRFYKVSKRTLDDISTVAAAFALDLASDGRIERLRVAYGGVAATAVRAGALERAAAGKSWDRTTLELLVPELEGLGSPLDDHRGSAAYRRALMSKLLEKFFAETSAGTELPA